MHNAPASRLWLLAIPLAFPLVMTVPIFLAARLERRASRPYQPVGDETALDIGQYAASMSRALLAQSFVPKSAGRQISKAVRAQLLCWLSPDCLTCAVVGEAKVLNIPQQRTWLYSRLADDCYVVTTDDSSWYDLSGLLHVGRYVGATFDRLYAFHQGRLAKGSNPAPWPADTSLETINDVLQKQRAMMVQRGRAYYLDAQQEFWRYTSLGAALYCREYLKQLFVALASPRRYAIGR
ncbi:MAG: hypothetical protein HKL96_00150 [Phycisphaerales bacterium]|nr:hypothetical protein [Phycisphaerales bacterium]